MRAPIASHPVKSRRPVDAESQTHSGLSRKVVTWLQEHMSGFIRGYCRNLRKSGCMIICRVGTLTTQPMTSMPTNTAMDWRRKTTIAPPVARFNSGQGHNPVGNRMKVVVFVIAVLLVLSGLFFCLDAAIPKSKATSAATPLVEFLLGIGFLFLGVFLGRKSRNY